MEKVWIPWGCHAVRKLGPMERPSIDAPVDSRWKSASIARHVKEDTSWWMHNPIIKLQLAYYFWEVHKGSQSSLCLFLTVITLTFLLSFPSCLWCCLCPYSHSHVKVFVKKEWFQSFQYIPVLVETQCWGRKRTTFPIFSFTLSLGLQGSSGVPKPLLSSWPFNNSYIVLTLVKVLTKAF